MKVLLINGSPRKGNTEFVLQKIKDKLEDSELLLLREKNIGHCEGCLYCHEKVECAVKDDMEEIRDKVLNSDVLVIGAPNYFDNVSGLLKDFIDRLHPFYKLESLKGKKVFFVFVGGGEKEGTKEYLTKSNYGFIKHLKLNLIDTFCFKALEANDLKNLGVENEIENIINEIKEVVE